MSTVRFNFLILFLTSTIVLAGLPIPVSDVASVEELSSIIAASVQDIEQALASEQSYRDRMDSMKRSLRLLILSAHCLSEKPINTKQGQPVGADLRDAAIALRAASSYEESLKAWLIVKSAASGQAIGRSKADTRWKDLVDFGTAMSSLKAHSESLRRAIRKPGEPEVDSRHAMAMALYAMVVYDHSERLKSESEQVKWKELSKDVQMNLTNTARSIKSRDGSAGMHFRLGMEACNTCHETFKR